MTHQDELGTKKCDTCSFWFEQKKTLETEGEGRLTRMRWTTVAKTEGLICNTRLCCEVGDQIKV